MEILTLFTETINGAWIKSVSCLIPNLQVGGYVITMDGKEKDYRKWRWRIDKIETLIGATQDSVCQSVSMTCCGPEEQWNDILRPSNRSDAYLDTSDGTYSVKVESEDKKPKRDFDKEPYTMDEVVRRLSPHGDRAGEWYCTSRQPYMAWRIDMAAKDGCIVRKLVHDMRERTVMEAPYQVPYHSGTLEELAQKIIKFNFRFLDDFDMSEWNLKKEQPYDIH